MAKIWKKCENPSRFPFYNMFFYPKHSAFLQKGSVDCRLCLGGILPDVGALMAYDGRLTQETFQQCVLHAPNRSRTKPCPYRPIFLWMPRPAPQKACVLRPVPYLKSAVRDNVSRWGRMGCRRMGGPGCVRKEDVRNASPRKVPHSAS